MTAGDATQLEEFGFQRGVAFGRSGTPRLQLAVQAQREAGEARKHLQRRTLRLVELAVVRAVDVQGTRLAVAR